MELYANFAHGLRFVPMKVITFVVKKIARGTYASIARNCQYFEKSVYKERVDRNPELYQWVEQMIANYFEFVDAHENIPFGHDVCSLASFDCDQFND